MHSPGPRQNGGRRGTGHSSTIATRNLHLAARRSPWAVMLRNRYFRQRHPRTPLREPLGAVKGAPGRPRVPPGVPGLACTNHREPAERSPTPGSPGRKIIAQPPPSKNLPGLPAAAVIRSMAGIRSPLTADTDPGCRAYGRAPPSPPCTIFLRPWSWGGGSPSPSASLWFLHYPRPGCATGGRLPAAAQFSDHIDCSATGGRVRSAASRSGHGSAPCASTPKPISPTSHHVGRRRATIPADSGGFADPHRRSLGGSMSALAGRPPTKDDEVGAAGSASR